MYTQCPECDTAFRVTAEVLKQAAGKVRCGGCGVAFNALDYLSEQKPATPDKAEPGASVPELRPDSSQPGNAPKAISAEHSAALLKTLDDLAGEDVRIEDTGVEWRVVDADDSGERPALDADDLDDTGSMKWFLDESPTPVDEPLSDEPGEMDAPEIFEEEPAATEEMRFDDDTPLPDDFDFDAEPSIIEPAPQFETRDAPSDLEGAQVDLTLGEPEDWEDLLGEVGEAKEPGGDKREMTLAEELESLPEPELETPAEVVEQIAADKDEVDELVEAAFDEPIPDVDKQFDTLAESMGIDLSGMHARLEEDDIELEPDDESVHDIEDTSIDEDLIAAAFEIEAEERARREDSIVEETLEVIDEPEEHEEVAAIEIEEPEAEEELAAIEIEEPEAKENEEDLEELEFEIELEEHLDLDEARDRELVVTTEADAKLAAELGLDDVSQPIEDQEPGKPEQVVPPMSEEEQTVNMMIDEDLLAIAITDEEGFASTIVQKQVETIAPAPLDAIEVDAEVEEEEPEDEFEAQVDGEEDLEIEADDEQPSDDDPSAEIEQLAAAGDPLVETIIMEGEYVRDREEEEKLEEVRRKTGDSSLKSVAAADVTDLNKEEEEPSKPPVKWGLAAGIALLVLLLIVQVLHQSREALAVYPAYNNTFGAIYRLLGNPVTPAWDISGWRFERSNATVEGEDSLRIYSEIGNKSSEPLPYPLINVSLTNRYQDVIGSKLLEPGDYLPGDLDTRTPVEPGTNFAALFSVDTPDANVHGFKLDVCYRYSGSQLKCAVDDFKR